MNFKKSKILLNKINALHDSGDLIQGGFSNLERDLFLQYLRELYELTSENAYRESADERSQRHSQIPQVNARHENTIQYQQEPPRNQEPVAIAPVITSPEPVPAPLVLQPPVPPPPVKEEPKQPAIPEELEELFDTETLDGLNNSRFGNAPISDIGRSMGINEKILTINELYGGNQQQFNSAIEALNRFATFEEAKIYLIKNIAVQNNWVAGSRKNKAQIFLNLVRRRYQ